VSLGAGGGGGDGAQLLIRQSERRHRCSNSELIQNEGDQRAETAEDEGGQGDREQAMDEGLQDFGRSCHSPHGIPCALRIEVKRARLHAAAFCSACFGSSPLAPYATDQSS
jgi:hypothetical protein